MTVKQKVIALAARWGVTIESGVFLRQFEVCAEAPQGRCWAAGLHELICSAWDMETASLMWKDMLERMQGYGKPEPCTDPACDWCDRSE